MLIHYSIAAYELLERKLSLSEKQEVYRVFYKVGKRMGLTKLPPGYVEWLPVRSSHLREDLQRSHYTRELFEQYRNHLGPVRYKVLTEAQKLVVPDRVRALLGAGRFSTLSLVVPLYKFSRMIRLDQWLKNLLLPPEYKVQIDELDVQTG
jgi:hypothetical protein